MFGKSRLLHISFILSKEDISFVPFKPQGTMAAECLDLQTPSPPTPGASSIMAHSMCHVGKKTHVDPAFPRWCLILQVWISAGCWVRRDQAFVSTPQTTYLFDMCFHAKIITLANNFFKSPHMLLSSSVSMTTSLTPTPECAKESMTYQ